MLHVAIVHTSLSATHCPQAMAVTCTLLSATCHHRSRVSPSATWCPRAIPVTHTSPSTACHHRSHVTVGRMVPPSSACHPHIAVACASPFMSPSAARCPQVIPITHMSPLTMCHHRSHVTISRMVPPSSACHPHIAIACASPFASPLAAWCPRAMPVTCASPSTMCHHRSHVTIGRMVRPSNARHPHVTVACTSPFTLPSAAQCPRATPVTRTLPLPVHHRSRRRWLHGAHKQHLSPARRCTQLEDAQSTIPKYDVIFMVFEEGNKHCMFLYVPSAVLVS